MLTAGDEFGRSQRGNNNAYAQDNETTWLDWANADQDLIQHVAGLAKFRADHAPYFADRFLTGQASGGPGLSRYSMAFGTGRHSGLDGSFA